MVSVMATACSICIYDILTQCTCCYQQEGTHYPRQVKLLVTCATKPVTAMWRCQSLGVMSWCRWTAIGPDIRRIILALCYYIGQITPIGIPDKYADLSHTGGNIIDAEAANLSPFISGCPMKPNYNCMHLTDRRGDDSNDHDIILLGLLGCSSRATRTSAPGRSSNRPVLQKNNASGSRPGRERLA
jgi:hypothetical protein